LIDLLINWSVMLLSLFSSDRQWHGRCYIYSATDHRWSSVLQVQHDHQSVVVVVTSRQWRCSTALASTARWISTHC